MFWLVTTRTSSVVPAGTPLIVSGGEVFTPSQVNCFGIGVFGPNDALVSVSAVERMTAPAVVLVDPLLAGAVDPVFLRAGAVAPDFGSSSARPLDPQAATVIMSAATSKRSRDLRR